MYKKIFINKYLHRLLLQCIRIQLLLGQILRTLDGVARACNPDGNRLLMIAVSAVLAGAKFSLLHLYFPSTILHKANH